MAMLGYEIVIDDPKIFDAAQRMIARYGDDVLVQIDARIEELSPIEGENADACKIWCQMRAAVAAILANPRETPIQ